MSHALPATATTGLEIAVIGMAGRFPMAGNVDELWRKLAAGIECISFFTDDELRTSGVNPEVFADPNYVKAGGIVDGVELFDAGFFGYSPREAMLIDPQQRLFLETAWTALEHAGYGPGTYAGPVGVYGGVGLNDYLRKHVLRDGRNNSELDHQAAVANDKDFLTTRVSYKLNLEGPSIVVQTACSTSLVAIHLACQALIAGECDIALAGGVTIRLPQKVGYLHQEGGMSSPDGHCRAFSARAQGCLPGNGGAIVVLKRLSDALIDRDCIHAVIKGSAINNDGSQKVGYTAPRVDGQARVIQAALRVAETPPDTIGYLEAHGTGTALGDPIEMEAATRAFRQTTDRQQYCAVGTVKTNVGHMDAAAGVTGFIKAALAVKHGVIPPSLHFDVPNPEIDFANSPFYVNTTCREWTPSGVRRAGVSSFGIGGTNAHVILEQPPVRPPLDRRRSDELVVVSAKTQTALEQSVENLAAYLAEHRDEDIGNVAFTLQCGRTSFPHRRAVVAGDMDELIARLKDPARTQTRSSSNVPKPPRLVFMFPGQGAQYPRMARGLYESKPEFRQHVDRAAAILRQQIGVDVRESICGGSEYGANNESLCDTRIAQPAIFTVSYALAQLFLGWGARPVAMIGHSIGEYVAACLAGVFSLEDALWLVSERGRLMSQIAPGAMLAVPLAAGELERRLPRGLGLAAINAPDMCVVSGATEAVEDFQLELRGHGCESRLLHTSHAFHSSMMDEVLESFKSRVAQITLRQPTIPYVSNVTGDWITSHEATDPDYWARHLRYTVRFSEGLQRVLEPGESVLLELGPGRTLTALAKRHLINGEVPAAFASMRHPDDPMTDEAILLQALGGIWTKGADIDWRRVQADSRSRRIPLPTYPFQRDRYWLEDGASTAAAGATSQRADIADWFSVPSWERLPQKESSARRRSDPPHLCAIFLDNSGLGEELGMRLRAAGRDVISVSVGRGFSRVGDREYELDPAASQGYEELCRVLGERGYESLQIVHCWTADVEEALQRNPANLQQHEDRGFYSLVFLAQALGAQAWLKSCHVAVVTTNVYDVIGNERLCPEKAMVVGPCRTIALEYAGLRCTHVDVALPPAETPSRCLLVDLLLETLDGPSEDVVAIRGSYRWRQTFVPLKLEAIGHVPLLKERGVYLITGGLGGIGLALAEYLATTVRGRLVLVGRTALPPKSDWDRLLNSGEPIHLNDTIAHLSSVEAQIAQQLNLLPISAEEGLEEALDRLCCGYVLEFLTRAGVDVSTPQVIDRDELAKKCRVLPQFHRLFTRMLSILAEDGFLIANDDSVRFTGGARPVDVDSLRREAGVRYLHMLPLFDLLDNCARRYSMILAGEVPALSLFFGEENAAIFKRAVENIRDHSCIPLCQAIVRELVLQLSTVRRSRPLRILEVGGGEELLTRELLPLLDGKNVEYHFTDIGRSFVLNAQRDAIARGMDSMRFGVLDISRPPAEQGFPRESVDVVLAFNVLHATKSLAESVKHASDLLAPGGLLIVQESVRPARWIDLIWGLTDGWWTFQDEPVRVASPLVGLETWTSVLQAAGLESVGVYPQDPQIRSATDTGVLIGRKAEVRGGHVAHPAVAEDTACGIDVRDRIAALRRLEQLGAEVEVVCADVADREQMRAAVDRAMSRFGTIDGVIHAALVLHDGTIQFKTREAAARVLAPKVAGTRTLQDVLRGVELEFFVMFSSLVSVLGGIGQVDYCAASNFQDAFAHAERSTLAKSVMSINWGAWREVGLAFRAAIDTGGDPDSVLPHGMSTVDGLEAFKRALGCGQSQITASPQTVSALMASRSASMPARSPNVAPPPVSPPSQSTEESGTRSTLAPRNETERLIADIWQEVLGVGQVSVEDNFFDLGGDSVISLQFIAKARKAGLRFTNRQVFEHQTIASLASAAAIDHADAGGKAS